MINRFIGIGRMTRDPELRRTNNGTAVTSFNLAINRTFQSSDGQEADFIPCVCWNKLAENVERYCSKGSLVGIEGELRSRSYDNSHGQKVFVVEALCSSVQFLETKKDQQNNQSQQSQQYYQQPQQPQQQNNWMNDGYTNQNSFGINEEDIQF